MVLSLELVGEGLLLAALVVAPWVYGSVEDTSRYALCTTVLVAMALYLWPDLRERQLPRCLAALTLPGLGLIQMALGQSVAPFFTIEATMVAAAMALVWASIDSRAGSTSTRTSQRLALTLVAVCASESAFAAFQWSTDRTSLFGQKIGLHTMPFGSYVNHNNFAGLVSLGVPLAVAMAIGDLRRSGRLNPKGLALMGLACGLAISVLASGSRGGFLALIAGLFSLVWIARGLRREGRSSEDPRRAWLVPLAIGWATLAVGVLAIPTSTRGRLTNLLDQSGSTDYRIDTAGAAFRAFASHPMLGSGLGAFGDAVTPFKIGHGDVRSERAEADLIEFAVEGGLVLIAGLLFFARSAWKSAHYEMAHSRGREGRWLRAGALASCLTMLFHSLFDFGFRIPANALAFAVLLGIATAGSEGTKPATALRCRAFVALLALLTVACIYRSIGAAGERAALARTSPESRLDALQSLVDRHPYLSEARRQRGLAWVSLAYSRGRYDATRLQRAHADLQAVVDARPQWGEARADLAWVKYYEGNVDEAKAEMREATRFDPTHIGVGIACAQMLVWSGDTAGAVGELARLRRTNPDWPPASARELAASWTSDPALLRNIP